MEFKFISFELVMCREWKKSSLDREREFSKSQKSSTRMSSISRSKIFEHRELSFENQASIREMQNRVLG